jgi:thioredoxin-related protein
MKAYALNPMTCAAAFCLLVPLFPCLLDSLSAEEAAAEVRWRTDYNAARREAQEKNRPLVIDFGTQFCYWCKRLDQTTFRDATVARVMNEHFVPLKIDAEKEAGLAQFLRIQSYPTIVLAGPDGKILGTHEGYMEAARFHEHLQRTLAAVANPEWMAADYDKAVKAVAGADYARAIALLRNILEDGKEKPVQLKARRLFRDLEKQAADRLAQARELSAKGQVPEAMDALTELGRVFGGTQAALEAGRLLATLEADPQYRSRRARELLAQAREDFRTKQYLCCMDRCEVLTSDYADLPEAEEARLLDAEIKNNPVWMQAVCESLGHRLGKWYLDLAESWLKKGQPQEAAQCLQRVLKTFPGTRHAETAQTRLDQIQGQTQQTNYRGTKE